MKDDERVEQRRPPSVEPATSNETASASRDRASVLDPIERVSEVVFGVLMAMTFTGSLSVASPGEEVRTMMFAAIGCNLAWGLTDSVMYLIGISTERHRRVHLLEQLHATQDRATAHRMIKDALPDRVAQGISQDTLEAIRERLLAVAAPATKLDRRDFAGAFSVFLLVVLATFPVVVPFMFIDRTHIALRVSNLLAVITMFVGGLILGRYAVGRAWRYGFVMSAVGAALVGIIVALGG